MINEIEKTSQRNPDAQLSDDSETQALIEQLPASNYSAKHAVSEGSQTQVPKKKKTGLIIALVAGIVTLIAIVLMIIVTTAKQIVPDNIEAVDPPAINQEEWDYGGVAATVNGVTILEEDITSRIEFVRSLNPAFSNQVAWSQSLADAGLTPESYRESIIMTLAQNIILTQEAVSRGLTVNEDSVNAMIAQTRNSAHATTDAEWLEELQSHGYHDELEYREQLIIDDLTMQMYETFRPDLDLGEKGLAFWDWINELVDNASIVINPMPQDVSYNASIR